MSEYGDDILSISDEDGNEYELTVLDEADLGDVHYFALTEAKSPEEMPDVEVIILKQIKDEETGEDLLSTVDSDEEMEAIYRVFEDRMFGEEEDEEDE